MFISNKEAVIKYVNNSILKYSIYIDIETVANDLIFKLNSFKFGEIRLSFEVGENYVKVFTTPWRALKLDEKLSSEICQYVAYVNRNTMDHPWSFVQKKYPECCVLFYPSEPELIAITTIECSSYPPTKEQLEASVLSVAEAFDRYADGWRAILDAGKTANEAIEINECSTKAEL